MTLIQFLLGAGMFPFSAALLLVVGLLLVELVLTFLGGSLLGGDTDGDIGGLDIGAPEAALDGADFDIGDLDLGDIDPGDIDLGDIDLGDLDPGDVDLAAAPADLADGVGETDMGVSALLSWLGLGQTPFAIWFAGVLTGFGLAGYVLQLTAQNAFGGTLPAAIAVLIALPAGIAFGARFARLIGRLVPKHESSAISRTSFGGRRAVITVGTARRGNPAQARFTDGHGNFHYAMVEPLHDHQEFAQGTNVAILKLRDGTLRAVALDD